MFLWKKDATRIGTIVQGLSREAGGASSGTRKFFEGLFTLLWYVGPMNHTPGIDYTGAANQSHPYSFAAKYIAVAAVLLSAAYLFRARRLRGN